jgi:hypothetical protein
VGQLRIIGSVEDRVTAPSGTERGTHGLQQGIVHHMSIAIEVGVNSTDLRSVSGFAVVRIILPSSRGSPMLKTVTTNSPVNRNLDPINRVGCNQSV